MSEFATSPDTAKYSASYGFSREPLRELPPDDREKRIGDALSLTHDAYAPQPVERVAIGSPTSRKERLDSLPPGRLIAEVSLYLTAHRDELTQAGYDLARGE